MKIKYLMAILLVFAVAGFVNAETFTPESGIFAYRDVENYTLEGLNFTVPVDYELQDGGDNFLSFKKENDTLNITVELNGTVDEVNSTNTTKASYTMLGSQEGYLIDDMGNYTFSYFEDNYLITISSKDVSLIMGVMGKDY